MKQQVEKWGFFEAALQGPNDGNPFLEISLSAEFKCGNETVCVNGFYDGDGVYRIRFMPRSTGEWRYITKSNCSELEHLSGSFDCVPPKAGNHGPVRVREKFHFEYEDQTPHYSFGTTCYAWIHQTEELQKITLQTLSEACFNKMRMCVFPKHYDYNHNEPKHYPFEGSLKTGFNFLKPNPAFFRHLESRILDLQGLGVECDLILFHPYDRWGFSAMGPDKDDLYLKYMVSRLAAFRNIWWSLANEYDLMERPITGICDKLAKNPEDWERFGRIIGENDPYSHLLSIHNCGKMYDHTKSFITHCSIQRTDVYRTSENTDQWRAAYGKAVVIDECAYEGNINHGWGNITGQEMVRRFWEGTLRGGYVGHGETYMHPDDILWWSHGGKLHGSSPSRIGFLRKLIEEAPGAFNPLANKDGGPAVSWDETAGSAADRCYLYYYGFNQPSFRTFIMPEGKKYRVDVIDTWDMTVTPLPELFDAGFRVELPAKQYMAVRITAV